MIPASPELNMSESFIKFRKDGLQCLKFGRVLSRCVVRKRTTDKVRQCFQANTWASDFVPTIKQVFGETAPVFACNVSNVIVIRKTI